MTDFKPMLAGTLTDIDSLKFPVIVSPKLDGIRCLVVAGRVVSRKLKDIPNHFIREQILKEADGWELDGEIMLDGKDFNEVQSAVMSEDGEPDFRYFVFDAIGGEPAVNRLSKLKAAYDTKVLNVVGDAGKKPDRILFLQHNVAHNSEDIVRYEEECLKQGYEGVMIRGMQGRYKFGRSTEREGYLLKMKRFHDAEATVVGFEQKMHNANEATKDELGRTKRSSHKANLVPVEMLGALKVKMPDGTEFSIGTGYDDAMRTEVWANQDKYLGSTVTYKYQQLSSYGVPRFPVFKCFRKD